MADLTSIARDQFTKQAAAFAAAPAMRNEETLQLLVELAHTTAQDQVLDVACGPGLVGCAFARVARYVTGIDLTPAMIEKASRLQTELGLSNLRWQVGEVVPLPFATGSFSLVVCRYAVHHFAQPTAAFHEMVRVCQPGGRVLVADVAVSADPGVAAAYNRMEQLRDPSHVRALTLEELNDLGRGAGLELLASAHYRLEMELEGLLAASFPNPGDADRIREMFEQSLERDRLGVEPRRDGQAIRFVYPITVLVWRR